MGDSRRVYRTVKRALKQAYPDKPQGNLARHLDTLALMVSGIVTGKSCQLSKIASEVPEGIHPDSRERQLRRWVNNDDITFSLYFLPFIEVLLQSLAATRPLVLIIDGSAVARQCVTLMVSVVYAQRAIPIGWLVIEGEKGHFPTERHLTLLREIKPQIPEVAQVTFLGDGEFDSPELQAELTTYGWDYVCRTAKNIQVQVDTVWQHLSNLPVTRGTRTFHKRALFTKKAYGPVMVIVWWDKKYQDPIYLVSNLSSVEQACTAYRKRMRIETFFSDQKSRGFQLDKSHLSDPDRVQRLMLAACLAYLWVLHLGTLAQQPKHLALFHRHERCDLSLFQLGLRWLKYLLAHDRLLPSSFKLKPESVR
jgi:hypothetical protein